MTAQTRAVLKAWFETGDIPTQAQFADLIDSFVIPGELASPTMTTIELGHASDTTFARTAPGRATIEGAEIVRSSTAQGGTGAAVLQNVVGIGQSAYNALGAPDASTLYVITGA